MNQRPLAVQLIPFAARTCFAGPEILWASPAGDRPFSCFRQLTLTSGLPVIREHHLQIAHELNSAEARVTGLELR